MRKWFTVAAMLVACLVTASPSPKFSVTVTPPHYLARWNYDCNSYAKPVKFELGVYLNGTYSRIGNPPCGQCVGNQFFQASGSSTLIKPGTVFYIRAVGKVGNVGPAAFYPQRGPGPPPGGTP